MSDLRETFGLVVQKAVARSLLHRQAATFLDSSLSYRVDAARARGLAVRTEPSQAVAVVSVVLDEPSFDPGAPPAPGAPDCHLIVLAVFVPLGNGTEVMRRAVVVSAGSLSDGLGIAAAVSRADLWRRGLLLHVASATVPCDSGPGAFADRLREELWEMLPPGSSGAFGQGAVLDGAPGLKPGPAAPVEERRGSSGDWRAAVAAAAGAAGGTASVAGGLVRLGTGTGVPRSAVRSPWPAAPLGDGALSASSVSVSVSVPRVLNAEALALHSVHGRDAYGMPRRRDGVRCGVPFRLPPAAPEEDVRVVWRLRSEAGREGRQVVLGWRCGLCGAFVGSAGGMRHHVGAWHPGVRARVGKGVPSGGVRVCEVVVTAAAGAPAERVAAEPATAGDEDDADDVIVPDDDSEGEEAGRGVVAPSGGDAAAVGSESESSAAAPAPRSRAALGGGARRRRRRRRDRSDSDSDGSSSSAAAGAAPEAAVRGGSRHARPGASSSSSSSSAAAPAPAVGSSALAAAIGHSGVRPEDLGCVPAASATSLGVDTGGAFDARVVRLPGLGAPASPGRGVRCLRRRLRRIEERAPRCDALDRKDVEELDAAAGARPRPLLSAVVGCSAAVALGLGDCFAPVRRVPSHPILAWLSPSYHKPDGASPRPPPTGHAQPPAAASSASSASFVPSGAAATRVPLSPLSAAAAAAASAAGPMAQLVRPYFRSRANAPVEPSHIDEDSDDDVTDTWALHRARSAIMRFGDVQAVEREFMLLWSGFVTRFRLQSMGASQRAVVAFARAHGPTMLRRGMRTCFLLHLVTMWDRGWLESQTISAAMQVLDSYAGTARRLVALAARSHGAAPPPAKRREPLASQDSD